MDEWIFDRKRFDDVDWVVEFEHGGEFHGEFERGLDWGLEGLELDFVFLVGDLDRSV